MFERLKHMLIKEFIQVFRDPRMRAVIFLIPVIQVLIFGYAVTTDVRHIPMALYDLDRSPASRDLRARFESSGYFDITEDLKAEAQVQQAIDSGRAKAVLRIEHGFAQDLGAGRTGRAQLVLDGSDSNTTGIILGYTSGIVSAYNGRVMVDRLARSRGLHLEDQPVTAVTRAWFNPNFESRYYFLPGVIAQLVMIVTVLLSSMAIVREREIGTMEQIMVTPIGRLEFILGKTIPFALIGFMDVAAISSVAVFWFKIPLEGFPPTLFFSTGLFLLSTLGTGLYISTLSHTQQQAMMTTFFFIMPAILLSGFIYPIANMPVVIQALTFLNPLRYFLVIIRGVYLKGTGFAELWPQMLGLAALGAATLSLAASRFKKTTD